VQRGYKGDNVKKSEAFGRETPFRQIMSPEAEKKPLLGAVTRKRLANILLAGKDCALVIC
jgi:hypothetical protein